MKPKVAFVANDNWKTENKRKRGGLMRKGRNNKYFISGTCPDCHPYQCHRADKPNIVRGPNE